MERQVLPRRRGFDWKLWPKSVEARASEWRLRKMISGIALLLLFFAQISKAQNVGLQWASSFFSPTDVIAVHAIETDASKNVYISGYFGGTVDFDPSAAVSNLTSVGLHDAFIGKYGPSGNLLWVKRIGASGYDGSYNLKIDAAGNIVVTGYFTGTVDFDPNAGVSNLTAQGTIEDAYVLKLDPNGNFVWVQGMGSVNTEYAFGISFTPAGDVLITGYNTGVTTVGPFTLTTAGGNDGFVAKLNSAGVFQWAKRLGGTGDDALFGVDSDAAGNVYVSGKSSGNMNGITSIAGAGGYVLKLDGNGNPIWTYFSTDATSYREIRVDTAGNIYAAADLGTVGLVKIDPNGNRVWAQLSGLHPPSLSLSPDNYIYATGNYVGPITIGSTTLNSNGNTDLFVAKFDPAGNPVWATSANGTGNEVGIGISTDFAGEVLISGFFNQLADFDPSQCVYNLTGPTNSNWSGFAMKLLEKPFPDGLTVTASSLAPLTQSACSLGIPNLIEGNAIGVTAPLGYSTTVSYQWQKSTSASGPWQNLEGEVFKDLQPPASSETLFYRRIVMAKNVFCALDSVAVSGVASVNISGSTAPVANSNGPQWFVCAAGNNTVSLNGSATGGTGPYNYQWYQGSSNGGTALAATSDLTTPAVTQSTTFTLKVTDAAGCIDTDQVTIVPAVANAGPDKSFCQGSGGSQIGTSPVASPSVVYAWTSISGDPVSSLSCTTCAQPIANPVATSVYRLTVTVTKKDGTTCVTTDDVTITPVTAPGGLTAFAGADPTICINSTVQLGNITDATYTYTWTPGLYLNATNAASPVFTAGSSGLAEGAINYTVTAAKNGCSFVDEVKATVLNSQTSDSGDTECGPRWVTHEGLPNVPTAVYSWSIVSGNGVVLSTANGGADALLKSNDGTTKFRRTVTVNGVSCSSDVDIIVCGGNCDFELKTISSQGCPKVFPGEQLRIAPINLSATDWNYRWSPANLVDNPTAREVTVLTNSPATITLMITNKYDASITCSESIDINPAGAAKPTIDLIDRFACYNTPTAIGTTTSGGFSYKWLNATGLDNDSIANPLATLTANQQYVVEITEQAFGCMITDTVNVTVANVVANAGIDRTVCNGATVALGTAAPAGTAWNYSWDPAGAAWTNGTNGTMPQPQVEFSQTGSQDFIVTVTDPASGCVAKDTVTLRNTLIPGEYASSASTICQGETIQLGRAPEAGATYAWTGAGLSCTTCANTVATPTETTTYNLQVSYPGCAAPMTDQVTITVNPVPAVTLNDVAACSQGAVAIGFGSNGNPAAPAGATFLWSPSTGLSSATAASPSATVNQPTTYSVIVTLPSGCTFTDQVTVTPNAGAGSDVSICPGESTQIGTPAIAGATYAWTGAGIVGAANLAQPTVKPATTTTYTVSVTTPGCTSTDQVVVTVNTPVDFNITGNTAICAGGSTTLSLVGTPAAGTTWQWSPTAGVASPTGTATTILPAATTTYRLTQTNLATGCSNFKEVVVVVNANTIAATATPLAVCAGEAAAMTLNVTSTGDYSYVWSPQTGLSNAFIANPTVTTGTARTYQVTITDAVSKCQLVQSVPVTIKPAVECLAPVALRGNVFHDANGLTDVTVNTTSPIAIPTGLFVSLIGSNGSLLATVPVGTDGAFDFGNVNADTYSIVLHQTAGGSTTPSLPATWLNMGENLGAGPGSDDAVSGILTNVTVLNVDVTNANFGIEVAPKADPYHRIIDQPEVGQVTNLSGSLPELTGSDPEDQPASGSLSGKTVVITILPTNTTLLYDGHPVMAGVEIEGFDPLKLQVEFTEETIGDINTSFEYAWVDEAGVQGTAAIYSLEWGDPMPVTLVSFEARIREGKTELAWATTEEANSDRFEIEHSTNGKAWALVGTVSAKGESKGRIDYAFEHMNPAKGENLYRLKMIDIDETFAYSGIRSVRLDVHAILTAYPNPAPDKLLIRNYPQVKQVVLHNASGVKIYQSQKLSSEGIDVSKLQNGIYTITLTLFDGTISTHKVAVTR